MNYKSDIGYRKEILKRLLNAIIVHEDEIISALKADFHKKARVILWKKNVQ